MRYCVREFTEANTEAVNAVALAAFAQYSGAYTDWPAFSRNISSMVSLAKDGEIIVAESERVASLVRLPILAPANQRARSSIQAG